jgi:hypothetical protein
LTLVPLGRFVILSRGVHIYAKLGLRSRAELAAETARRDCA